MFLQHDFDPQNHSITGRDTGLHMVVSGPSNGIRATLEHFENISEGHTGQSPEEESQFDVVKPSFSFLFHSFSPAGSALNELQLHNLSGIKAKRTNPALRPNIVPF
ncbi:unnamed protein product [Pleuronectes platessa]|uniref:Uncharacterized protein n=1 Tax=Pleuronectes platessa TaxID=8262 RepID=A0A9N7Y722_PLEPL|nr:unnamed protein product [Pleuronectes platessa]